MCQKHSTAIINLYGHIFRVDPCMKKILIPIRDSGIKTLACCCGHGKYPMTIVYETPTGPEEWFSGAKIPRKKRFYVRDSEGFYYIPEVCRPKGF